MRDVSTVLNDAINDYAITASSADRSSGAARPGFCLSPGDRRSHARRTASPLDRSVPYIIDHVTPARIRTPVSGISIAR